MHFAFFATALSSWRLVSTANFPKCSVGEETREAKIGRRAGALNSTLLIEFLPNAFVNNAFSRCARRSFRMRLVVVVVVAFFSGRSGRILSVIVCIKIACRMAEWQMAKVRRRLRAMKPATTSGLVRHEQRIIRQRALLYFSLSPLCPFLALSLSPLFMLPFPLSLFLSLFRSRLRSFSP